MNNLKVMILAWWSWTRLWPISRGLYPKQFVKLSEFNNVSFFQETINRALKITTLENIVVVTNQNYKFHCLNQAFEVNAPLNENQIICEPVAKNTLAAICLWMETSLDTDNFVVLSSDHVIEDNDAFAKEIIDANEIASEKIVLFWIKPDIAHTWYWYINPEITNNKYKKVVEFNEKPNLETAKIYLEKWYLWNGWIFMFNKWNFLKELSLVNPEYYNQIKSWILNNFNSLPDLSIDYWLLEKTKNIVVTQLNLYWNDLWSHDAYDDYFKRIWIKNDNLIEVSSEKNFILWENINKKIALVWCEDLIVVDTADALLISKKWESQKVKDVVWILKKQKSEVAEFSTTVYRPWWSYTIIDEWAWFKTKRITVLPGKKLSSQMHHHRSEHWVVVSWTWLVTIWENQKIVAKWESVFIKIWEKHRLENPWKTILHIIESQIGDYLEEDDIVRFDDDFGR